MTAPQRSGAKPLPSEPRQEPIRRRAEKSATAFRTISEVAQELDVPQHVLRFWETKFPQVRPLKRGGGRRYYRPEDVELLRAIRGLLYSDGYTIKGVQKLMREGALKPQGEAVEAPAGEAEGEAEVAPPRSESEPARGGVLNNEQRAELQAAMAELSMLRDRLRRFVG